MYIETSGNMFGSTVFVGFGRTQFIQIINTTFYNIRYSNPTSKIRSTGDLKLNCYYRMTDGIQNK